MRLFVEVKPKLSLFCTGMLQVFFVAMNTTFITHSLTLAVFLTGFTISLIWSFNVKRVAFGTFCDRILYALGAALGSVLGMIGGQYIAGMIFY